MFNLITSIIAVALTAALAAAEIIYIGPAFLTSTPKAVAAQIIASMSQIDAAWTMWGTTTATTTTFPTITGTGLVTDLLGVPGAANTQFLAAIPTAPATAATWGGVLLSNKYQIDHYNTAAATVAETDELGIFVALDSTSLSICTEIARAGGQITPTGTLAAPGTGLVLNVSAPASFTTAFTGYKYGCVGITGGVAGAISFNAVVSAAGDIPAGGVTQRYVAYFKQ